MEGTLHNLAIGFAHVFEPLNLLILVAGIVLGLLVAVLPGLTLVMGVVLALPFTYSMHVIPAIILLTAMYVSGTYAGAWTSILFRVPGEPIDVPLLWDGYTMARKGEAAYALGWTLISALVGGLVAATVMVLLAQPIAKIALTFSTPEYFAILFFGLASVVSLGG
ncbi:MAG: tripartite tricarboxylate transporter permease, partial [Burkholderiales bacterium]|nr:tripartite tricarboxylate transporter permease [Burkholderiales bacterium]